MRSPEDSPTTAAARPPEEAETVINKSAEIRAGLKSSVAAGFGMFPLGIAFGLLVTQSGLAAWVAPLLSFTGYAGSLEMLMIDMIVNTTALVTVALTTFFVNFRHVFYAFSFPLHVVKNPIAKFYSMYALTDEAYAITAAKPEGWTAWSLIPMQMALQFYWVFGGIVGAVAGSLIPTTIQGLDFALCAMFITLTLDASRTRDRIPSLLLGGLAFAIAIILTPDSVIFTGLIVFMVMLIIRYAIEKIRRDKNDHTPTTTARTAGGEN